MSESTNSQLILYQAKDGEPQIQVTMQDETVWLTQKEMAELFQRDQSVISRHVNNVFKEGELDEESNMQKMHIANSDKPVAYYNLDVIISVGYRVKSHRGTQFRIWATQTLREYLVKGFVINDERLKGTEQNYFDELVERVRHIRTSEKQFYRKVLDIFSTSIDYDTKTAQAQEFFATVQNKFHYAIHGHTAAELISERVDSAVPVYMSQWVVKLDAFLRFNEKEILQHKGRVSRQDMETKVREELEKYKEQTIALDGSDE